MSAGPNLEFENREQLIRTVVQTLEENLVIIDGLGILIAAAHLDQAINSLRSAIIPSNLD